MSASSTTARLHILNKPPAHLRFGSCLEQIALQDSLLLLEDGVLGLTDADLHKLAAQVPVYVLEADADARGLSQPVAAGHTSEQAPEWCSMARVVELTEQHQQIINW